MEAIFFYFWIRVNKLGVLQHQSSFLKSLGSLMKTIGISYRYNQLKSYINQWKLPQGIVKHFHLIGGRRKYNLDSRRKFHHRLHPIVETAPVQELYFFVIDLFAIDRKRSAGQTPEKKKKLSVTRLARGKNMCVLDWISSIFPLFFKKKVESYKTNRRLLVKHLSVSIENVVILEKVSSGLASIGVHFGHPFRDVVW